MAKGTSVKKGLLFFGSVLLLGTMTAIGILWYRGVFMKTTVVLYDGPATLEDATADDLKAVGEGDRDITLKHCVDTQVKVNGEDCYVYDTNVNHSRVWDSGYHPALSRTPITYFDFEGKVEIQVIVPERELNEVTVSPLSYEIEPVINQENHTVTFSITKPDTYTVMFDGAPERALHIFANALETDVPDMNDESVVYVEPGEWDMNTIRLRDGQTLYLAGGAVVHGTIKAEGAKNVKVMGRGILDGSKLPGWQGRAPFIEMDFSACDGVVVQDITVLNPNAWVCQGYETENMEINGLKIISCRPNGDGITLQSCRNVEVSNSFVRSWDDSLVVKNYYRNSYNINFSNIQLWTDFAQSMEVGYETNKGKQEDSSITNITFTDICVLHNYHKPVISVHNADDAVVSDIVFRNIIVEDSQVGSGDGDVMPYLIDLNITYNDSWSSTQERGTIQNITIDNVKVLSGVFNTSRINGYDEQHKVSDVTISNLEILGQKITDAENGKFIINEETTEGIVIN